MRYAGDAIKFPDGRPGDGGPAGGTRKRSKLAGFLIRNYVDWTCRTIP
jgi:hypothetical protein